MYKDEVKQAIFEAFEYIALKNFIKSELVKAINSFPDHKGRPGQVGGSLPKDNSDIEKDIKTNLKDLLGEEFENIKGQDAINKVYKERKGHVKNAFYRSDIGEITVCWGDDTCGLKHLEKERIDRKQDVLEIIRNIGKVITKGYIFKEENDRWKIRYKDATVIISKELKGEKAIAIITGYKKNKKP